MADSDRPNTAGPNPGRRQFMAAALPLVLLGSGAPEALAALGAQSGAGTEDKSSGMPQEGPMKEKLVVVWTSGDRDVALRMVFMYTYNAKVQGWWKDVTMVVWGASQQLLAVDSEIRDYVKKMVGAGIKLEACKACADSYGVADNLAACGLDVKYMGVPLTEYVKDEKTAVMTF